MLKLCVLLCLLTFFVLAGSACSIAISPDSIATTSTQISSTPTSALPGPHIPVTWGSLHLTGRLVYIDGGEKIDSLTMTVRALDLETGRVNTIFQGPDNSWIYSTAVSPDGKQLVMSYSPPLENSGLGNPSLYVMPMDGSKPPQPLFTPSSNHDEYFQPDWSADGRYIYFTRVNREATTQAGQLYSDFQVYRISYPDGQLQEIADEAFWPRVSADSTRLVYVAIDPIAGTNKLFLANMDGGDAQEVVMSGTEAPNIIDAPLFSADGASILFSAVSLFQSSSPTWLEKILGMTVASAHSVPSDWWSVPIGGGIPKQITHLQVTGLFASISPDKKYIVSYSGYGLFVMNPDGTGEKMLLNSVGGMPSTVNWIP